MTTEERLKLIEVLNEIPKVRVKFNIDAPIYDEVERIQNTVLGILRNELNIQLSTEKKEGKAVKYSFQQDLARISVHIGFQLSTTLTLYEFETYKKIAIEKSKPVKQK